MQDSKKSTQELIDENILLQRRIKELEYLESRNMELKKNLQERIKELNFIYSISDIIERTSTIDDFLGNIIKKMPLALYYTELACARIVLKDQEFKTANFKETAWKMATDIFVHKKAFGTLEIYYLEKMPEKEEGPFLKEERSLLDAAAEHMGRVIECKLDEKEREEIIHAELQKAISEVKILSGLLPICASCKKIRNDTGYWEQIESYIKSRSQAEFSHSICPDCMRKLYPEFLEKFTTSFSNS